MLLRELTEAVERLKFLRPGELRGSYSDSQMLAMGFRRARNGAWFISQTRWNELVSSRQIESIELDERIVKVSGGYELKSRNITVGESLTELRRNPEQNPKLSVNQQIINKSDSAGELFPAWTNRLFDITTPATKNLFVSFTQLDKLGINPQSEYNTPIGIYAYPADYVIKSVGTDRSIVNGLPFASEKKWVNIFSSKGNIVNLRSLSESEYNHYVTKIAKLYIQAKLHPSTKESVRGFNILKREIEADIPRVSTVRGYGNWLWALTLHCADLFSRVWKISTPVAWNKLFRLIGIDGCVDISGGIIHPNEPTQAVFFSINAIGSVERIRNTGSKHLPKEIEKSKIRGQKKRINALNNIKAANSVTSAGDEVSEGWKDWVMGAGIAAAGVGGMSAAYDYMNQKDQPAPQQAVSVGKVQPAPQPSLMQRATKPLEKSLIKAAEAAGLKGTELQQFMAQCAHESMNFDSLEELGNDKYFARKYDKKYNPAKAKTLGNVNVGDGIRYKGRGYIQLTGRYNYAKAGEALGLPLEQKPELAARPDVAAKVALWFWNHRVATKVDNFADTKAATKPINPGLKHLDKRIEKFKHYSGQATPPLSAAPTPQTKPVKKV